MSIKNKDTTYLTYTRVYITLRFSNRIITMASPLTRYSNTVRFTALLTRIDLSASERERLITDEFTNMEELVSHLTYNTNGFKSYLVQLNKTCGATNDAALRLYYTPVFMSRLLGVLYLIDQSVNMYHMVPDINEICLQVSNTYADAYRSIPENAIKTRKTFSYRN